MRHSILTIAVFSVFYFQLSAQEVRSFDGFNNNRSNPEMGAAGSMMKNYVSPSFQDGIASPNGLDRPNPRTISNNLFAQDSKLDDGRLLSDMVWVFGQFIDHDVTKVHDSRTEPAMIPVPQGDVLFDPFNTGTMVIPMMRSLGVAGTGTDVNNPRRYHNEITSFIDGSNIYGSSEERSNWLRTFEGGKMHTSEDNLLPFNTLTRSFNSDGDPLSPAMDNPVGLTDKLYVAGDSRANENILLTAIHTIFHREHNRVCDELKTQNPSWNDEQLFQKARRLVSGMLQNIAYSEWLPAMGIHLPAYQGYAPAVDPTMSNVFSAAAFRLGHTLLNGNLMRLDKNGEVIGQGNIELRNAFFNPNQVLLGGGIEPLLQGMAFQVQQKLDCKVVDDVRNFLFGPPGAGGLDLAAINIARGRERGLPSYTAVRAAFGLSAINSFDDITVDQEMIDGLKSTYGEVNKIDPWVGMLAEDHMDDAMIGPTLMSIMMQQFQDTRDGDRFFFMVDPGLSTEDRQTISATRMSHIIMRNTDLKVMQENVFVAADPHKVVAINEKHLEILPYPNPFTEGFELAMFSNREGSVTLEVFDQSGRMITIQNEVVFIGTNVFDVQMDQQLPIGLYTVRATINDSSSTSKLLKVSR